MQADLCNGCDMGGCCAMFRFRSFLLCVTLFWFDGFSFLSIMPRDLLGSHLRNNIPLISSLFSVAHCLTPAPLKLRPYGAMFIMCLP